MSDRSDSVFDYATFLANSARGSLEEGVFSASLRLIDALGRLPQIVPESIDSDSFLKEITEIVNRGKTTNFLESRDAYIKFLDEILKRFAQEIKKRNGLS